ncbi:Uncharacterised protein [Mycobacteroides abscessus subsp. abscessus]|nr:Uncharacterised protein [Mycobacteroides abscessus subsp. abscessus]
MSATSTPYAPTFCTGVAPAAPGIPERHSSPPNPASIVASTRASHATPASAVTCARPDSRPVPKSTCPLSITTAVPSNPSSEINRFDPPPMMRTRSDSASSAVISSTTLRVSGQCTIACAGPPTRNVVRSASGADCRAEGLSITV